MGVGSQRMFGFSAKGTHRVPELGREWLALQLSGRFSAAVRISDIEAVSLWVEADAVLGAKVCTAENIYHTQQTVAAVLDAILSAEGGGK